MTRCILALDQGTTSSRALVFDHTARILGVAQREFPQILPSPGDVQHDPEAIWNSQLATAREALAHAGCTAQDVAAIGIANQRETTILWERNTGRAVANAIVWQSRISAPICERLKAEGLEPLFRQKTGLLLDAYFSGTKIKYLLDTIDGLRTRAERGEVLFGTVDSFLTWRLSGGKFHGIDSSNASRTLLMNLHTLDWDDELLRLLDIPRAMLPKIHGESEVRAMTEPSLFGSPIPLAATCGDQQAATFGQGCFEPGMAKNTYGTGCFLLLNTGTEPVLSQNNLITTVGWQLNGQTTYCLEGSVFIAGAAVQWLRDGLGLIRSSSEIEALAATEQDSGGVLLVPAFVGLGAPYWDPYARGTIIGITRGTTAGHLARATIDSMAYQTADLVEAMRRDSTLQLSRLRVDGGAAANNHLMQFQADLLGAHVERPHVTETTALGAASLAGLAVGFWENQAQLSTLHTLERQFEPTMPPAERQERMRQWHRAVKRSLGWVEKT